MSMEATFQFDGRQVVVTAPSGDTWKLAPSFARLKRLGTHRDVADLHQCLFGVRAPEGARRVAARRVLLACLGEQGDPLPLLGWVDKDQLLHEGHLSHAEQVDFAKHLISLSLLNADEETLNRPEYLSHVPFMQSNEPTTPKWDAYIAHLREISNV